MGPDNWLKLNSKSAICLNIGSENKLVDWNCQNHPDRIHIIIGPEGDFSDKEKRLMEGYKIPFLSMGLRRLRAETAAITALNIIEHSTSGLVAGG